MHRLPFIILFLFGCSLMMAQSPHGSDFMMECSSCHTATNWLVNKDSIQFDHDSTKLLIAGHVIVVWCFQKLTPIVYPAIRTCIARRWEMIVHDVIRPIRGL